jgi:hypothetical protein
MDSEQYTKYELLEDINMLIRLDLIDCKLREDNEWVYKITEKGRQMTDDQVSEVIDEAIRQRDNQEMPEEE